MWPLQSTFVLLLVVHLPRGACPAPASSPSAPPPPPPLTAQMPFDCLRISPVFCCAKRIRQSCSRLCSSSAPSACVGSLLKSEASMAPPSPPFVAPSGVHFVNSFDSNSSDFFGNFPPPPPILRQLSRQRLINGYHEHGETVNHWSQSESAILSTENVRQQKTSDPTPSFKFGPSVAPPIYPPFISPPPPPPPPLFLSSISPPPPPPPPPPIYPPFISSPPPTSPPFPPLSPSLCPPSSLVLPPPDVPNAKGTPIPLEDDDNIEDNAHEDPNSELIQPHGRLEIRNEMATKEPTPQPSSAEETAQKVFLPTLIPQTMAELGSSIDGQPNEKETDENDEEVRKANGLIDGKAGRERGKGQRAKALKVPQLMGELEEFEEGTRRKEGEETAKGRGDDGSMAEEEQLREETEQQHGPEGSRRQSTSGRTTMPERSHPLPTAENGTLAPNSSGRFHSSANASQLWNAQIGPQDGQVPSQGIAIENRRDLPIPKIDKEQEEKVDGGEMDLTISRELLRSIAKITSSRRDGGRSQLSNKKSAFSTQRPSMPGQCGVGPDFVPCVPLDQANARLLSCCQQKQMPVGCLPLCRYDTTQAQVKHTFEKGQCGLLNIAPFLVCASQGHNNVQCCRHREIVKRTGAQCEVFCDPSSGLGLLGIQHLVCQNAIQTMLQCHHAGLL